MLSRRDSRRDRAPDQDDTPSLRTLLHELGTGTEALLRAELTLARMEFRDMARQAAFDGAKIGAAMAIAFVGALAIVTWLVFVLGDALGGSYGSAALIVGAVLLIVGLGLALAGLKGLRRKPRSAPSEPFQSRREWVAAELQQRREAQQQRGLPLPDTPHVPPQHRPRT
jgi:hypothetical protein